MDDALNRINSARKQADAIGALTDEERRTLAVAGISELHAASRAVDAPIAKARAVPQMASLAAQVARVAKVGPVVGPAPAAKRSRKPAPAVLPVYNKAGELIGVTDPDRLISIPAGSAVYDAQGRATGIVGADGKVTVLADGPEAVKKAVDAMIGQATRVAKQLEARKAQRPAPASRDALAILTAWGQRVNMATVVKSQDSDATVHPLVAAALAYDKASPAGQASVRKALARCTPESRRRAQVALRNAVESTLGTSGGRR
jgi:hypothetical protein